MAGDITRYASGHQWILKDKYLDIDGYIDGYQWILKDKQRCSRIGALIPSDKYPRK
jgi:hypothetical protein